MRLQTPMMLMSAVGIAAAAMVSTTTHGLADTTIGPVYPNTTSAPFCESCWASAPTTDGAIGKAGGVTWTYDPIDATQFDQAEWGLWYPDKPTTFSFGDGTVDLAYDATASDLSAGTLIFDNDAILFPNLDTTTATDEIELVVQTEPYDSSPAPAFESYSAGLSSVDSSVGAVLPVTGNFQVNLLFEVSADGGTTWTPANDYFNDTPHSSSATTASVDAGFWYTAVGTPAVSFGTTPLAFGNVPVSTTSSLDETITNTGTADLHITEIDAGGDYSAPSDTCVGVAVAPGKTCDITVDFTPSIAGTDNGSLTIDDDAADSPQTLTLTGAGAQAQAVFSPNPLDFGPVAVGTSQSAGLNMSNPGTDTLSLSDVELGGADPTDFNVSPGTCSPTLDAGLNCNLQVAFTPGATGPRSATLTFTDNASPSTQVVTLNGTGAQTAATVLPNNLDFGTHPVGKTSTPKIVTITSSGSASMNVTGYTYTGADLGDFSVTGGSCPAAPFALAPGAACTLDLLFKPTAAGARSATFVVSDDAGTQQVLVGGTGRASSDVAVFIGASAGTVNSGTNVTYTVVVQNNGPSAAAGVTFTNALPRGATFVSITGGACSAPPAGYSGTIVCSLGSIASGSSETLTITVTLTGRHQALINETVSVSSSSFDPITANNRASRTVKIH